MIRIPRHFLICAGLALAAGICVAQNWGGGRGGRWRGGGGETGPMVRTEGGDLVNEDTVRTARETASHSTSTPDWTNAPGFESDVFTFARIIYKFGSGPRAGRSSRWGWINDYPDSDLNFSYRLQQMTSIRADPNGRTIKLTNSALFDYPWIYVVKAGRMELRDEEVPILRRYLLNGGVLMADDFWGPRDWDSFEGEIKKVLPERSWTELPMSHPLFHCVFDIRAEKNKLQVPSIGLGERSLDPNSPQFGNTSRNGVESKDVHVRAWLDDAGRIMVIATHNTDNGDGWEREGENHDYFQTFSEQRAYPLGFNIVLYVMTH